MIELLKTLFIFVTVIIATSSCDDCYYLKSSEYRKFELVQINPPKRMYVTLKDVETGEIHKNIYVSKRCSNWENNKIGDIYLLNYKTYVSKKNNNTIHRFDDDLYSVFCK